MQPPPRADGDAAFDTGTSNVAHLRVDLANAVEILEPGQDDTRLSRLTFTGYGSSPSYPTFQ